MEGRFSSLLFPEVKGEFPEVSMPVVEVTAPTNGMMMRYEMGAEMKAIRNV